jgi:BlaI family penicillinase repressor
MSSEVPVADPGQLSKRERQIMDVIYGLGEATVTQVLAGIPDPPMRGALRTLLRIMEGKGLLTRHQAGGGGGEGGGEIVYRPVQPRGRAARSALERVLDVFFSGSLEKAVAAHLSVSARSKKLKREELERLSDLIEQAKRKGV